MAENINGLTDIMATDVNLQLSGIHSTNYIKLDIDKKANNADEIDKVQINVDENLEPRDDDDKNIIDDGKHDETKGDLLALPRAGHRMSCMEEESVKERLRVSLLKQCSAILKQSDEKFTKESLHKAFQDEVSG